MKNRLNDKRKQVIHQPSHANIIAVDVSFRSDLLISKIVPDQYIVGAPSDVEELFRRKNAEHVHAVHVSQMNIFGIEPLTPMSWQNMNSNTTGAGQDVLNRVLRALDGQLL